MPYYNTIPLKFGSAEYKKRIGKMANQEAKVLEWFTVNVGAWTPSEVWEFCFKGSIPLTSVRRAITDLTHDGKLFKTQIRRKGLYGELNNTWMLAGAVLISEAKHGEN